LIFRHIERPSTTKYTPTACPVEESALVYAF
jgi:hypothetical protein